MGIDLNRQEKLNLNVPKHVTIVGCGGVGTWTSLYLSMAGVENFLLFDDDMIEEHNLNRQWFKQTQVGENKAKSLGENLKEFRTDVSVVSVEAHLGEFNKELIPENSVVFCAVDNQTARKIINKLNNQKIFMYAEEHTSILSYGTPDGGDWEFETGYTVIPQSVIPNTLTAILGVSRILNQTNLKQAKDKVEINVLELFEKVEEVKKV